jgi:hypothetical protein
MSNIGGTEDGRLVPGRDYIIMPALLDDTPFILDSWCASYGRSPAVLPIDPQIFKIEQRALVAGILTRGRTAVARPRSHVTVDGRPARATDILGWVSYEFDVYQNTPIIHYCYVKQVARSQGVAETLVLEAAGVTRQTTAYCSHFTPVVKALQEKTNLFFNPYVLMVPGRKPQ